MRLAIAMLVCAAALPLGAQEKPHIFIAPNAAWRAHQSDDRQAETEVENRTVEIAADFSRTCTAATVSVDFGEASYIAEFNRRIESVPMTHLAVDRTDVSLYRPNGDLVGGASKLSLGAAVKAVCGVIKKDWPTAPQSMRPARVTPGKSPSVKPTAYPQ